MAGILAHLPTGEVAVSAGVPMTVLQIVAAANHRVLLSGFSVMFKGTSATDTPVKIRILRQTTAGTMSSVTIVKNNDGDDETLQTTGRHTASAEPTAGDVLETLEVHPQAGLLFFYPAGKEIVIKGGGRLGFEVTAAQNQTVSINATIEE